jgi:hypothetical protein
MIEILLISFLIPIVVTISRVCWLSVDVFMKYSGVNSIKYKIETRNDSKRGKSRINGDYGRQ